MTLLSKTRYLQYLRCPKLFWLAANTPDAIPAADDSAEHRMAEGRQVEEWARRMFGDGDGKVIDHDLGLDDIIDESVSALNAPSLGDRIFRPVVKAGRLVAEMDVVRCTREARLDIYEVKSGSDVTDDHLNDIAFQRYVAGKAGLPMGECAVVTVRTDYVRQGAIDSSRLFRIQDVTAAMDPHLAAVEANVAGALNVMDLPQCPDTPIGPRCTDCPLKDTPDGCWKAVNAEPCNVFSLYRLRTQRAWGWYGQGYLRSRDIPSDWPLTDKQAIQIRTETTGKPHVNRRQVRAFFNQLEYPLYLLDFETFAAAIPLIDGSSPYEQVPFQFSLHTLRKNLEDRPEHVSWIWDAEPRTDPRRQMLAYLKHLLGDGGTILAYNAVFEKTVLKKAAALHPAYEEWLGGILPRFVDLLIPFRSFHLYHPDQHGKCSLKATLPAWTGKGYAGMAISGGEQAGREYMRVVFDGGTETEKKRLIANLEAYCGLDTMGMVDLLRAMDGLCR